MAHDQLALKEFFNDADPYKLLACRKFLKQPSSEAYSFERSLRIGDHYNGQKEDLPFQDDTLITTINKFIKAIPLYPPQAFFHIYVPAFNEPSDRTMIVYGHDDKVVSKISTALREIFSAYRNDDLALINIKKLADVFVEKEALNSKIPTAKSVTHEVISIADYLNGAVVDHVDPKETEEQPHLEDHIGRIKFDESLSIKLFDGERKAGLRRLRQTFADKLHVTMTPTHHDHCLDLAGSKEDVNIAYLVGRKIAPLINDGIKIDAERINKTLRDVRHDVGIDTVDELLGYTSERKLKAESRDAAKTTPDQPRWASGIGSFEVDQPDPNQTVQIFVNPAP